ncbi:HK97 family phage major capsid protein [Novosphingobium kunmingense]|uniref:HK97 family phage major capsid protein n=1 Tax=Novosphingobium kunmingense TaxID=1211806 RepID=A0A2N0HL14_9SPHN|nr:phage major capsid protein [Novosphingobium kunmingense]PKB19651.1 HK97 family phage major capsid protein [Novosphingobium kunmingense]
MRNLMKASSALAALSLASMPRAVTAAPRADAGDPAALFAELRKAHEDYKSTVEANLGKKADDAVVQAKLDKLNADMSDLTTAIEEAQRKLAAATLGGTGGPADPEHDAQIKAYIRSGTVPTVQAAMSEGTDSAGGYMIPIEWDRTINNKLKQRSPIRENAQVVTIGDRGFIRVFNDGVIGSGWVGETAARPETTTPGLTTLTFEPGEIYANPAVTQRMLDDAGFDLEQWLTSEVDGEFAIQENTAFLSGNGTNKPYGILTYVTGAANAARHPWGAITATTAAAVAAIDPDELLSLVGSLPSEREANAKFYMNRSTLFALRKLKDANDNYLWQPNYAAGEPATLLGYPVVEVPGMPTLATGNVTVLFGNMEQTYLVVDRLGTRVLRDPFTNKPYVHFYTTKRVGGGVQNPEYMKALKMA